MGKECVGLDLLDEECCFIVENKLFFVLVCVIDLIEGDLGFDKFLFLLDDFYGK